jgi:hypothetical protein
VGRLLEADRVTYTGPPSSWYEPPEASRFYRERPYCGACLKACDMVKGKSECCKATCYDPDNDMEVVSDD